MKYIHKPHNRLIAALLVLVCLLGLLPTTAMAATPDTIKMDDCAYNGVSRQNWFWMCWEARKNWGRSLMKTTSIPIC